MSNTVFSEKRTRSQLTLPDFTLPLHRSPLKDARTALRAHQTPHPSDLKRAAMMDLDPGGPEGADDEILLSPRKNSILPIHNNTNNNTRINSNTKRSASPPPKDEYSSGPSSPSEGRELKRAKRDVHTTENGESDIENTNTDAHRLTHTRARSFEHGVDSSGRKGLRKRSATASSARKPVSYSGSNPPSSSIVLVGKGRARSVPIFLSSSVVPHLDLKNPPPSPWRSRSPSRSPSREPKLRITSGAVVAMARLDPILDVGVGEGMDVDEGAPSKSASQPLPLVSISEPATPSATTSTLPLPPILEPTVTTTATSTGATLTPSLPSTPAPAPFSKLSFPMSPLTPLPETPLPSKIGIAAPGVRDRYMSGTGWGKSLLGEKAREARDKMDMERESVPHPEPTLPGPNPLPSIGTNIETTRKCRLPRPSSVNLSSAAMAPPPPPSPSKANNRGSSNLMAPPAALPVQKPTFAPAPAPAAVKKVSGSVSSQNPSAPNAFSVLMSSARKGKGKDTAQAGMRKGKDKAVTAGSSTAGPSSVAVPSLTSGGVNGVGKAKGKQKGKEKAQAQEKPKVTIKAKMRPREQPKPKPKPVLMPVGSGMGVSEEEGGEGCEARSPSPPASPTRRGIASRPLTPSKTPTPETPVEREREGQIEPNPVASQVAAEPEQENEPIPPTSTRQDEQETTSAEDAAAPESVPTSNSVVEPTPVPAIAPPPSNLDPVHSTDTGKTVLSVGKAKGAVAGPAIGRVTRSVSLKRKAKEAEGSTRGLVRKKSFSFSSATPTSKKTPGIGENLPRDPAASSSSLSEVPTDAGCDGMMSTPGSPMKLSSPVRGVPRHSLAPKAMGTSSSFAKPTSSSAAKITTVPKSPTKTRLDMKLARSQSPTKFVRPSSMSSARPSGTFARTFTAGANGSGTRGPSSLSTLANALEKLRMPPPVRPNSSMGFNRDSGDDGDESFELKKGSKDDGGIGRGALGIGRPVGGLKRHATVAAGEMDVGRSRKASLLGAKGAGGSVDDPTSGSSSYVKELVQRPMSTFLSGGSGVAVNGKGRLLVGTGSVIRGWKSAAEGSKTGEKGRICGVGGGGFGMGMGMGRGRVVQKVSRKTSLPSVTASPGKDEDGDAGIRDDAMDGVEGEVRNTDDTSAGLDADVVMDAASDSGAQGNSDLSELLFETAEMGKGKEKEKGHADAWRKNASRRASMASQALSQSLSSLTPTEPNGLGLMGPPETPVRGRGVVRSTSSSYPSETSTSSFSGKASGSSGSGLGMSSSTRSAMGAKSAPGALGKIKGGVGGHVSSGRKVQDENGAAAADPVSELLRVLKECTIFVDVRTDDGDDAGGLFVDMLKGMGARMLTRVGQTCTHIVYKNGLMSTLTRYRLLHEPRPIVVGIAWVVECVEQRTLVDETKFIIDLEGVNVAGINKRRRSMLPKLISREPEDVGSSDLEREREGGDGDLSMEGSSSSMILDDDLPPLEKARLRRGMLLGPRP